MTPVGAGSPLTDLDSPPPGAITEYAQRQMVAKLRASEVPTSWDPLLARSKLLCAERLLDCGKGAGVMKSGDLSADQRSPQYASARQHVIRVLRRANGGDLPGSDDYPTVAKRIDRLVRTLVATRQAELTGRVGVQTHGWDGAQGEGYGAGGRADGRKAPSSKELVTLEADEHLRGVELQLNGDRLRSGRIPPAEDVAVSSRSLRRANPTICTMGDLSLEDDTAASSATARRPTRFQHSRGGSPAAEWSLFGRFIGVLAHSAAEPAPAELSFGQSDENSGVLVEDGLFSGSDFEGRPAPTVSPHGFVYLLCRYPAAMLFLADMRSAGEVAQLNGVRTAAYIDRVITEMRDEMTERRVTVTAAMQAVSRMRLHVHYQSAVCATVLSSTPAGSSFGSSRRIREPSDEEAEGDVHHRRTRPKGDDTKSVCFGWAERNLGKAVAKCCPHGASGCRYRHAFADQAEKTRLRKRLGV